MIVSIIVQVMIIVIIVDMGVKGIVKVLKGSGEYMTENKRFTITGDRGISDHQKKRLYDLNDFDGMISVTETLNELHDENKELKAKVDDKEVAVEVECEKLMQKVFDLIDEKIKYYRKQPILAVRISANCEHRKSCLHNQEVNVCNKAKENAYRELKKELQE